MTPTHRISVLAGSSALAIEDGNLICTPQLRAFEKALEFATSVRNQIGRIFLQIDHHGNFSEQFLRNDISGEKKRHPKMDCLIPEILMSFQPISDRFEFPLNQIFLIPEQHCRMALSQYYVARGDLRAGHDCESIVAEIFRRLARHGTKIVAFWEENAKRVNPLTIDLGKARAKDMFGVQHEIENIFLNGGSDSSVSVQCSRV